MVKVGGREDKRGRRMKGDSGRMQVWRREEVRLRESNAAEDEGKDQW